MIGDNLMILRNLHGYSQEKVAEVIGVSRQAYAKWETNLTIPDIERCRKIAEFYGVTIDSLVKTESLEGVGTIPPAPEGKNIWGSVVMNERGQIVIPKATRDKHRFLGGQRFIVLSDDEGIALLPAEAFENKMRKIMEYASVENTD